MSTRFNAQLSHWRRRKNHLGDAAVGRIGESYVDQGDRIAKCVENLIGDLFVSHALDFGCGWGRLSEMLARHCGHLWVADVFKDWIDRAAGFIPTATPVLMKAQKVDVVAGSMDVVFDIMTIQSIENDSLAREAMHEIRRVAAPGATVVSLHIDRPRAPTRTASQRAAHMGLSKWAAMTVTDVDCAGDKYSLVTGTRV